MTKGRYNNACFLPYTVVVCIRLSDRRVRLAAPDFRDGSWQSLDMPHDRGAKLHVGRARNIGRSAVSVRKRAPYMVPLFLCDHVMAQSRFKSQLIPTTEYLWDDETDIVVMEIDGNDITPVVHDSNP